MNNLVKKWVAISLFLLMVMTGVVIQRPVQAHIDYASPTYWWSKDEWNGNDYMLEFHIPLNARWRIVGSNSKYQSVIDTAISQGGIQRNFINIDGYRVIVFATGGRARWLRPRYYYGSLNDYRRNVRVQYW